MVKDGTSFQPKMSTNKQIKVRTQVLCKGLRYPAFKFTIYSEHQKSEKKKCHKISKFSDAILAKHSMWT